MFKFFPCGANKIPLIRGWQAEATNDPEKIKLWTDLFREKLTFWGVPTGPENGILVLDVDTKGNGFETIKTLDLPPTMSQRTPSGGAHYIFKYPTDGKNYGNKVKFLPGLDIRGTGGYICWYGANGYPIAEPPGWLTEQTVKPTYEYSGSVIKIAPEIAASIIEGSLDIIRNASEGERNNTINVEAFKIGQLVASGSITKEYAEAAITKAAEECGESPYHIKATIRSALDGGSKKPLTSPFGDNAPVASFPLPPPPGSERYTPRFFTREDLLNTSKLRRPQLFEHWSSEDISITTADGGTGKTTLKLFEAICLALGERFLGFNCKQPGKTLLITGEDTAEKLAAMLGQIVRQMGLFDSPSCADKIQTILDSIVIKKDADLCLIFKDRHSFMIPNSEAMRKVLQAAEDIKPKMIVFDPISSFWGSEMALNDMNKAVTKFMSELVDRTGACVEMINHMGKVSSQNKDMTQFAGRGGTGLPSNARISRVLRPIFEDEYTELTGESLTEKQSAMMCNVNKFTDGSPLYNKPFLILRDGFLFSRKNLTDAKARDAERELSDAERAFGFIKECRVSNKYPTTKQVVAHFVLSNSLPKARVERALSLLTLNGHMGESLKLIENPDQTQKTQVYTITDQSDKEI